MDSIDPFWSLQLQVTSDPFAVQENRHCASGLRCFQFCVTRADPNHNKHIHIYIYNYSMYIYSSIVDNDGISLKNKLDCIPMGAPHREDHHTPLTPCVLPRVKNNGNGEL